MLRKLLVFTLIVALLASSATYFCYQELVAWSSRPFPLASEVVVDLPRGTSLRSLSARLEQQGIVSNAQVFRVWIRYFSQFNHFQAGTYKFDQAVSPEQVARKFITGDTFTPVVYQIAVPEGFTVRQVLIRLTAGEIATVEQLEALTSDKAFLKELRIPSNTLEGFLYPATYSFVKRPNARQVLSKMVQTFWERLPNNYEAQVKSQGLSLLEAVTFASLIEMETRLEEEKPKVSEVIWRRLKARVALAIDASIIYGIKDFDGNLRWKHLKDKSNPYNTRTHRGLPPTPIGSPSRSSLEAVLTPTDQGYFYYVLDMKDGSRHHFSKSLKEHNRHVKELVQEQKRRKKAARSS